MKIIKLLIATAIIAIVVGSCRTKKCPGYGEVRNDNQIEMRA